MDMLFSLILAGVVILAGVQTGKVTDGLNRAKLTLKNICKFYDAGHDNLLNENYSVE